MVRARFAVSVVITGDKDIEESDMVRVRFSRSAYCEIPV